MKRRSKCCFGWTVLFFVVSIFFFFASDLLVLDTYKVADKVFPCTYDLTMTAKSGESYHVASGIIVNEVKHEIKDVESGEHYSIEDSKFKYLAVKLKKGEPYKLHEDVRFGLIVFNVTMIALIEAFLFYKAKKELKVLKIEDKR